MLRTRYTGTGPGLFFPNGYYPIAGLTFGADRRRNRPSPFHATARSTNAWFKIKYFKAPNKAEKLVNSASQLITHHSSLI
ncbi:MAG: hypothetical protein ABI707_12705 [Ferruginibacter sp.]